MQHQTITNRGPAPSPSRILLFASAPSLAALTLVSGASSSDPPPFAVECIVSCAANPLLSVCRVAFPSPSPPLFFFLSLPLSPFPHSSQANYRQTAHGNKSKHQQANRPPLPSPLERPSSAAVPLVQHRHQRQTATATAQGIHPIPSHPSALDSTRLDPTRPVRSFVHSSKIPRDETKSHTHALRPKTLGIATTGIACVARSQDPPVTGVVRRKSCKAGLPVRIAASIVCP